MEVITTEIEGVTKITEVDLETSEELIAAQAAVTAVKGPSHPLVDPEASVINIARALRTDGPDVPRLVVKNSIAEDLVESLEAVARTEEDNFRNTARYMLSGAGLEAPKIEPFYYEHVAFGNDSIVAKIKKATSPTQSTPVLSNSYVELHTFQERSTVLRAVMDFADAEARDDAVEALTKDINLIDPFNVQASTYAGPVASVSVECLIESSRRAETVHDKIAQLMIDKCDMNLLADTRSLSLAA